MRLTKAERKFIELACELADGVYDYENNNDKEFRRAYGISKKRSSVMLASLSKKMREAPKIKLTVAAPPPVKLSEAKLFLLTSKKKK